MFSGLKRFLLLGISWISLGLGVLGIFLPILPTTPFAILSAYIFSKTSPRLHAWLLSRPVLGDLITQWERHGIIRTRAKILSTSLIIPLFSYTLIFVKVHLFIKIMVATIGVCVLTFILTRPSKIKS